MTQQPQDQPAPKGKKKTWRSCCGCLGVGFVMLLILGIIGSFIDDPAAEDTTASEPVARQTMWQGR